MRVWSWFALIVMVVFLSAGASVVVAAESSSVLEQSMSDTLDTWREGRYELLYERLAHRGKMSKEVFVQKMQASTIRPACCWQKMENFRVLNEKRTEATVYVKIGLEGTLGADASTTREFKLSHLEGTWKMHLADVVAIAGVKAKKSGTKRHSR